MALRECAVVEIAVAGLMFPVLDDLLSVQYLTYPAVLYGLYW